MKRFLSVLLAVFVLLVCFSVPAFAADSLVCPNCGGSLSRVTISAPINGESYKCTRCNYYYQTGGIFGKEFLHFGSDTPPASGSGSLEKPKKYYTAPSSGSGGSTSNSYTYNGGSTSYYSVMNTSNKTLNYTTYNQTTNNYTTNNYTYNNYTYNNEYNYYTYNIENKNYYVTNNITYVTVLYPDGTQDENGNDNYDHVDIYYELPDGRNSYNVKAEDIWGTYLTYNVTGAERVLEDDGVTLGLWHLDGNFSDSSANAGLYTLTSGFTTFVDTEVGDFGQAISGSSGSVALANFAFSSSPWTFEYRLYSAASSSTVNISLPCSDTYRTYKGNPDSSSPSSTSSKAILLSVPANQWNTIAYCYDGSSFKVFVNGVLSKTVTPGVYKKGVQVEYWNNKGSWQKTYEGTYSYPASSTDSDLGSSTNHELKYYFNKTYSFDGALSVSASGSKITVDEVRLSNRILYTGPYTPSLQPYDTNSVLVKPENPLENDIVIMSNVPVSDYRIGGVRPTFPESGSTYIYLENDVVKSVQQYQGEGWNAVDAFIYRDGSWVDLKNFNMKDLEFVEPEKPGPTPPPPTSTPSGNICKHEYKAVNTKEPTCTEKGIITYTCSLCGNSYTETVKALGHDWQKVETVSSEPSSSPVLSSSSAPSSTPSDDSSAPASTEAPAEPAYTLYRCSRCGEEYKDYDGSGPPAPPADDEKGGIWDWIKKLVKSIVDGILGVLEEVVGGIIDFIVKLVDDFFEGVKSVVHNLIESLKQIADFGGEFKDFLGSVFSFLPPEIVILLSFMLSLAIVLAIIKFIRG